MNFNFDFLKKQAGNTNTPKFNFSFPTTNSQAINTNNISKTTNDEFIIIVKDRKYICNKYAVNLSEIIREFRQKNPNVKEYNYEGPAENFEIICSYFNFKPITISKKNLEPLRVISENLKINSLLSKINSFISSYEEKAQKMNPIKELFNCLYHIKELTVESVKNSIVNSIFSHQEGNVIELASFIMHVVRSSFALQPFLVDLIIALDESSDETNDLNFLKPYISKRILDIFYASKFYCCFAYQLSKRGVIPIQDIIKKIISIDNYVIKEKPTAKSGFGSLSAPRLGSNNSNSSGWGSNSSNSSGWGSNKSNSSGFGSSNTTGWGTAASSGWGSPNNSGFTFPSSNTSSNAVNKSDSTPININGVDIYDELIQLLLEFDVTKHQNIVSWFLPELIENKLITADDLLKDYISSFVNGKMDAYKKMRDTLEPDNQISKAILDDDVESLQSILSQNNVDINSCLPRDIFNIFDVENEKSLLNYSAENGSIKCFKFLLLKHAIPDQFTLGYAIYGGNTELIKIIDEQTKSTDDQPNPYINSNCPPKQKEQKGFSFSFGTTPKPPKKNEFTGYFQFNKDSLMSPIDFTIMNHQYDLFDWIVDAKINSKELTNECLSHLLEISLISGNVHSFTFCINEGLKLSNCLVDNLDMIKISSIFGFCRFIELISSVNYYLTIHAGTVMNESCVIAGNISIFKLFVKKFKIDYSKMLDFAIQKDFGAIVKYILDYLYHPQKKEEILSIFKLVIEQDLFSIFKILIEKYPLDNMYGKFVMQDFISLCQTSCSNRNYDISKTLIDFLIRCYFDADLTSLFFKSFVSESEEICKYLLQQKQFIKFDELINNYQKIFVLNSKLALKLLDEFDTDIKESLERLLFDASISNNNKDVFELFLHKNLDKRHILLGAVNFNDINLVNQILSHNSEPSFINQVSQSGTALSIAINNDNLAINNNSLQHRN